MCFRNFPVAKKVMDKPGEGGYKDFPSSFFFLRMPKTLVGESSRVSLVLISAFSKIFSSQSTEKLRRGPFCVSQKFCYRKNLWTRGERGRSEYHDILLNYLCLRIPKNLVE